MLFAKISYTYYEEMRYGVCIVGWNGPWYDMTPLSNFQSKLINLESGA